MSVVLLIDLVLRTVLLGLGGMGVFSGNDGDFWKGAALMAMAFLWSISTYLYRLVLQAEK